MFLIQVETTIAKKLHPRGNQNPNYCQDDTSLPNSYRWVFSQSFPCFEAGGVWSWSKESCFNCVEALENGELRVERVVDDAIDPTYLAVVDRINRVAAKGKSKLQDMVHRRLVDYASKFLRRYLTFATGLF